MKSKIVALAAMGAAVIATAASAQQAVAPAAPAAAIPPPVMGPAIPGLCVFAQEQAIAASKVGKFAIQRLQQLDAQSSAELQSQKTVIETEAKTLDGKRATLAEAAFNTEAQAITQKAQLFQQTVQVRMQESELTQQKALQRIGQEMSPLVRDTFQAQKCSILLDRNAILLASPAMDITSAVVTRLDAKIQQFAIERERLPAQTPQAAAPAAAGAPARR